MSADFCIKLVLVLQFALAAAVPCRCIAKQFSTPESSESASCCRHGPCAAINSDPLTDRASVCLKLPARSTCPGRLLPDLSLPPTTDERLALLSGDAAPFAAIIDVDAQRRDPRREFDRQRRSRSAPAFGDQSLLGLHCALIV